MLRRPFLRYATLFALGTLAPRRVAALEASRAPFGYDEDGFPRYGHRGTPGPANLFRHGVASGDPEATRVMLWTRVTTPRRDAVDVYYEVAHDASFRERAAAGYVVAKEESDFTVKVDVAGLRAGQSYYYRFHALGRISPHGRTRTTPVGRVAHARFALCSCSSYGSGTFVGYRKIAERPDLDGVIHVGDYIYEYGNAPGARARLVDPPHDCVTLDDYRRRYALHRTDPDLRAAHAAHPFFTVWDDHEFANDAWRDGAENHRPDEGPWAARKAAAMQAYAEWMPIREPAPGRIYRRFTFGDLCDLTLLDTRILARDFQPYSFRSTQPLLDPQRRLLGPEQERWLDDVLTTDGQIFRLVAQQVMVGELSRVGAPENSGNEVPMRVDSWDGYPAARRRVLSHIRDYAKGDVVVLSGDIHASFADELPLDPHDGAYDRATGRGSIAVEFVAPGITSPPVLPPDALPWILAENPHIQWGEIGARGYVVVDVTRERVQGAWFFLDDVTNPASGEAFASAWSVRRGTHRLEQDSVPHTNGITREF